MFLTSGLNGTVISFPPGHVSHSLMSARSMLSKSEVGVVSWIGGIGPGWYFLIVLWAGCFLEFAWPFAASSSLSNCDILVGGLEGFCVAQFVPACLSLVWSVGLRLSVCLFEFVAPQ